MLTTNILFLGGAKRVSLAEHLINTGKQYGLDVEIFSYELEQTVPIALVAKVIIGKKWKDADLMVDLERVILSNNISIILPFVDPAIVVCAKVKRKFSSLFIPISDEYICDVMFNKALSAIWFKQNNVPQPKGFLQGESFEYPVILKPIFGSASKGIIICQSPKDLPEGINYEKYIVQKYISNRTEYTVDCYVAQDGRIISVVPRVRLETAGGEVIKSKTIRHEQILNATKKILKTNAFRGPITVQFIEDKDTGEVFVMEINPRLGGGVITSIEANSQLLNALFEEFLGKQPVYRNDWEEGLLLTRYFKEVIFHADNN